MFHIFPEDNSSQQIRLIKKPFLLLNKLFKRKKYIDDCVTNKTILTMERERPSSSCNPLSPLNGHVPRVPSTLSVSGVDFVVRTSCSSSPAVSTLTLTPGRTRDIDQDMQALRLSRQDNPFLQVLASRESLVDSLEESESDDANLMAQEFPVDLDVDPLTLPEIHEHMIRSPPPITWPKSPNFKVFRFPLQSSEDDSSQESLQHCGKKAPLKIVSARRLCSNNDGSKRVLSPDTPSSSSQTVLSGVFNISPRLHHRSNSDTQNRSPNPFTLLNTETRRIQKKNSDDNEQLMSEGEVDVESNIYVVSKQAL